MAEIRKFTADEAMSAEQAGKWSVQAKQDADGDGTNYHKNVSDYHTVIIDCTGTIDILFDIVSNTSCSDTNDLKIPAGVTSIKVPHGLGNTIYLHWRSNGSTTPTVRLIFT